MPKQPSNNPLRAAIYCRVSTDDQSCERQRLELTNWAINSGYSIVQVFEEKASGTKSDRKERKKVIDLAHKRLIDCVLVSELSRWGRSTQDLLETIQQLADNDVAIKAYNGQQLDIKSASGKFVLSMLAAVAEFERNLIVERVKSGLNNARAKGKVLGRPKGMTVPIGKQKRAKALLLEGIAIRKVAKEVGITPRTVQRIKAMMPEFNSSLNDDSTTSKRYNQLEIKPN